MGKKNEPDPQALERLRELLPEGSTIHAITLDVARNGMAATIGFYRFECDTRTETVVTYWLSRLIANAGLGQWHERREGIRVHGCGFDRALHVVAHVSRKLYGREGALRMERL